MSIAVQRVIDQQGHRSPGDRLGGEIVAVGRRTAEAGEQRVDADRTRVVGDAAQLHEPGLTDHALERCGFVRFELVDERGHRDHRCQAGSQVGWLSFGTMPSSWIRVGASSANTGADAVPPKRSNVPAGGSSTDTSTVT